MKTKQLSEIANDDLIYHDRITWGFTGRRIFKERQRKLFMSDSNVEKYETWSRIINDDVLHRQPQKELFLSQTLNSDETSVTEVGPNDAVKENPVLEFCEARSVEEDLEEAIVGEWVGLDLLREETSWQALRAEEVVDGGRGERKG